MISPHITSIPTLLHRQTRRPLPTNHLLQNLRRTHRHNIQTLYLLRPHRILRQRKQSHLMIVKVLPEIAISYSLNFVRL